MVARKVWPMNDDGETFAIIAEDGEIYTVTPNTAENAKHEARLLRASLEEERVGNWSSVHAIKIDHRL